MTVLATSACALAAAPASAAPAHPGGHRHSDRAGHVHGIRQAKHLNRLVARLAPSKKVNVSHASEVTTVSTPPTTTPPLLPTLFQSSFNSFSGWYAQALPGRISLVSGSAYEGAGDARFEVRPGDVEPDTGSNRAELSGPTFNAGEDLYVRDAVRVPAANTFQGSWQIIQQLHETDWGGSPGIAVFLGADRSLTLGAGDGSPTFWHGPALAAERWYDLVYHVKLSSDPAVGFVEVWLNGVPQQLSNGQTKAFGPTIQTAHTYLKVGIYRGKASTGISVVEHDNVVVGTSLAAVMGA